VPSRGDLAAQVRARAPVFAALGDETRLAIVGKLATGPRSITQLTDGEQITRQAITKHLGVLAGAGLVANERRGRERVYTLVPAPLDDARRSLELVSAQWDRALARLRAFVEE
jgi:DNA-binding transcriptional ArsR family regulator